MIKHTRHFLTNHALKCSTRLVEWSVLTLAAGEVFSAAGTFGQSAATITGSFTAIAQLITATSYIAGIGFSLGAIMKFKQHKDNPTQIPIGTPLSLLGIGAALLFFPVILGMAGQSIFGASTGAAGATGTAWT